MTPEEKELVEAFAEESEEIIRQAIEMLDELESGEGNAERFATVAGRIDGIMGCAKTLGLGGQPQLTTALKVISQMSEGCKHLGYKAAQLKNPDLIPIVAGFLVEAVEMIEAGITTLRKGYVAFDEKVADRIRERLTWLTGRMQLSDKDQQELLARFGLK